MNFDPVLRSDEKAVFALRALYRKYGYKQYKMSKFEEYGLYLNNKDFLVSDNVITFTDTDGRLMALKPDVTLSIIKNGRDVQGGLQKVYYDENVYRVSKGTKSFKEIRPVGLECLGDVDDYAVTEVLYLASKSLQGISDEYLLDVSSLDVIKGVMEDANLSLSAQKEILYYLSEKNVNGIEQVCQKEKVEDTDALIKLVKTYGKPEKVKKVLDEISCSEKTRLAIVRLLSIVDALSAFGESGKIEIDFSVAGDMKYYNGIVFKGFISGIPTGILSGGQYDNLMEKMEKNSRAIGFAVYLDELGKFGGEVNTGVDVAIQYNDAPIEEVVKLVKEITENGESVIAEKVIPCKTKYKRLIELGKGVKL
ncbi:MAG: ATP phosphoribosyltransferase regulatory subunit [Clostridia bacterium]|nr:ATP phosphoribosyltransferase regulatory subunit [Clostridia bacterium]